MTDAATLAELRPRLEAVMSRLPGYSAKLKIDHTGLPVVELWRDGFRVAIQSARPWLTEMERAHA
ncbi:hypothetical protein CEW88_11630 [Alloyangia pacifica]|uniref:Uncharacterized protein n=1 Tax=Alloyangia pacifica TaxID=311180 RepID=A0A2U8HER6_9RHOB|nr:hypothetical protein [Alloyangia pacifica]AWI84278.1 hypothetical protein CEW88_11630 [Alloyangia pacifica]